MDIQILYRKTLRPSDMLRSELFPIITKHRPPVFPDCQPVFDFRLDLVNEQIDRHLLILQ